MQGGIGLSLSVISPCFLRQLLELERELAPRGDRGKKIIYEPVVLAGKIQLRFFLATGESSPAYVCWCFTSMALPLDSRHSNKIYYYVSVLHGFAFVSHIGGFESGGGRLLFQVSCSQFRPGHSKKSLPAYPLKKEVSSSRTVVPERACFPFSSLPHGPV